jgi:putative flippase GtrA
VNSEPLSYNETHVSAAALMQPELVTQADQGFMGAASTLAHRLHLPTTLVKFMIVGAIAFIINQLALFLFYDSPVFWFLPDKNTSVDLGLFSDSDIRALISLVLAGEVAIVFQFYAHEHWTFRNREQTEWWLLRFLKFNISAAFIFLLVTSNALRLTFDLSPYFALAIGVMISFVWNWTLNTLVIWPRAEETGT